MVPFTVEKKVVWNFSSGNGEYEIKNCTIDECKTNGRFPNTKFGTFTSPIKNRSLRTVNSTGNTTVQSLQTTENNGTYSQTKKYNSRLLHELDKSGFSESKEAQKIR